MKLYEIDAQIEQIEHMSEDGLLIDPETGELLTIAQALDALHMARDEKIENVACGIKNREAEIAAIKNEQSALADRRRALENKVKGSKEWLIAALTRPDGTTDRVKSGRVSVSVRKNAPSVICDESLLPDAYKVKNTTVSPDKDAIKRAILDGQEVPGAHLEAGRSVSIK